jgi:hypothetical protein
MQIAKLCKVDEARREVTGICALEAPDLSGEVMDYESSKPFFIQFTSDSLKRSNGLSKGVLREMHGLIASGKIIIRCDNVGPNRKRHSPRPEPRATPDDRQKTEGGKKFAKELGASGSWMVRSEKQRFTEHQVSGCNTGKSADDLRPKVGWHLAPGQAALRSVCQRYGWVEVRS